MKKTLLILVLFFNLLPCYRGESICLQSLPQTMAQAIPCPTVNGGGSGGGFWNWLGGLLSDLGNAVGAVAGWIQDFVDGSGGGGGETFEDPDGEWDSQSNAGWTIGGISYFPGTTSYTFTQDNWNILNNLGGYYNQYQGLVGNTGLTPIYFLTREGDPNGSKYYDGSYIYLPVEGSGNYDFINLVLHNENGTVPSILKWYNTIDNTAVVESPSDFNTYSNTPNKISISIKDGDVANSAPPILNAKLDINGAPPCSSIPGAYIDDCGQCVLAGQGCSMPAPTYVPYTLTSTDQTIWDQIHQQDNSTVYNASNNPCHGTFRSGNVRWPGTLQHWIIMLDWMMTGLSTHDVEYAVPGSSANGNYGYADMVDLVSHEMFEIKPDNPNGIMIGSAEVAMYAAQANVHCPPIGGWSAGASYTTRILPCGNPQKRLQARFDPSHPGVILYSYVSGGTPLPVALPQSVIDELKEMVRKIREHMADAEKIIADYLHQHPGLVTYLKNAAFTAAVAIVVGTIVEDIATSGFGVADDWASFALAYRIIRFAWSL